MSLQKSKKTACWMQCDNCSAFLQSRDTECHSKDCPPELKTISYNFIKDTILYGLTEVKTNEDIKNVSAHEKDNLVFLSESAIKLCELAIGKWAIIQSIDNVPPVAKVVWPSIEKSLTSVLLTKRGLELSFIQSNQQVMVKQLKLPLQEASFVSLIILNASKSLEVTPELHNRLSKNYDNTFLTTGNKIKVMFYGKELIFEIKSINSSVDSVEKCFEKMAIGDRRKYEFYKIVSKTKWNCFRDEESYKNKSESVVVDRPAGVEDEIEEIKELMNACLGQSIHPTQIKAVLLYGNSGTGKTSIAKYVASQTTANVIMIHSPDIFCNHLNNVEKYIKMLFSDALENTPSIIILDEFDVVCPARSNRLTETEKRVVSIFLRIFDDLYTQKSKIFLIATTNKPDNIDPAFRRSGRLDRELEIPTPNPKSRLAILKKLLKQLNIEINKQDLQDISLNTHGFVGSDLVSLCSMASLNANKQKQENVSKEDFAYALKRVRPSAMREVQIEISNVKWSDIGGQNNLKIILKQAIEWPLKYPHSFLRLGVTPPKGVLMFGPPGCSKTMIAKALACESGLNFLSIKGPELFSKWVGESERAVREVFRKARQVAPSIIFFDEIDALGGERSGNSGSNVQERVLAQLLTELDGITPLQDVTILAATNRPDRIDKALLRPGRLDRIVYVSLPDEQTRKDIFRIKFLKMPTSAVNIDDLVERTENYSGAEVNAVCHEAAMLALEENLESEFVEMKHFEKALTLVTPRTPISLIKLYDDYISLKT